MKNKIKEVHDYFKKKIVNGDYETTEFDEYWCQILIDSEYKFCLWLSNGVDYFRTYSGQFNSMSIEFNKEEQKKAFMLLYSKHRMNVRELKQAKLDKLKAELEEDLI